MSEILPVDLDDLIIAAKDIGKRTDYSPMHGRDPSYPVLDSRDIDLREVNALTQPLK